MAAYGESNFSRQELVFVGRKGGDWARRLLDLIVLNPYRHALCPIHILYPQPPSTSLASHSFRLHSFVHTHQAHPLRKIRTPPPPSLQAIAIAAAVSKGERGSSTTSPARTQPKRHHQLSRQRDAWPTPVSSARREREQSEREGQRFLFCDGDADLPPADRRVRAAEDFGRAGDRCWDLREEAERDRTMSLCGKG